MSVFIKSTSNLYHYDSDSIKYANEMIQIWGWFMKSDNYNVGIKPETFRKINFSGHWDKKFKNGNQNSVASL